MDVEDILALLNAPECERKPLPSGFDPWSLQRWDVGSVHASGYQKAVQEKGVTVVCHVCGKQRVVHPMMAGKALACTKHKDRAYQDRCRAQGRRWYTNGHERKQRAAQRKAG